MKFGLFFIFFFILLSCAQQTKPHRPTTTKLTPPKINFNANGDLESIDTFLQKKARHLNSPETVLSYEWWSRYQRARLWEKKNPKLSCQLFRELSQDHHFPLKDLAALRAVQICTLTQSEQVSLPSETYDHYPDWLHPLAIESFLIKSKKENNISQQIQLLIKKSKWSRQRKEKIAFTLKALHLTSSLKDLQEAKKLKQELIQRRDMLAPRFIKKAHTKDYLKIAYDFRRNRNFPKAKKFYSRLLRKKVSDKTKIKAFNGLRQTYKIERKLNKYLLTTERMAMFLKRRYRSAKRKWKSYFNGLYTLARTYWTLGKKNKAKKNFISLFFFSEKHHANMLYIHMHTFFLVYILCIYLSISNFCYSYVYMYT